MASTDTTGDDIKEEKVMELSAPQEAVAGRSGTVSPVKAVASTRSAALPQEAKAGTSGAVALKGNPELIEVEVKPFVKEEVLTIMMEVDSDQNDDDDDEDDSDVDVKVKQELHTEDDSDDSSDSSSDSDDSDYFGDKKKCKSEPEDDQEEFYMDPTEDYKKVFVENYTSSTIKEEPVDSYDEMFKKSPLKVEKERFHQQIFEKLIDTIKRSELKDLQTLYIAQLRKVTNIEIFSCSLCKYQTMNFSNLKCHIYLIHKAKLKSDVYQCNHCDYKAQYQSYMKVHLPSHKKLKQKYKKKMKLEKHPCPECSYQGRTEEGLKRHMSIHKEEVTICDLCSFKSDDKCALKEHKETHKAGPHKYQCYQCSYVSNNKLQVGIHLLNVHNIANEMSKRSKICEICSHTFNNMNQLQKHLLTHKDISELSESDIFRCHQCTFQTKYKDHLKLHMVTHKDPAFVCEVCGFATRHKKSYKEHLIVHKNPDEIQWWNCEICSYQGRTKKLLYKHMRRGNHNKKSKNPEDEIKKQEKTKCSLCTFQSDDKKTLLEHKNTHKAGEKRYQCYQCDYVNSSKLQVGIHLLNVHKIANEVSKKSKICEVCSLSFANKHHLKRHLITHKDISELDESEIYKCEICGHQTKYERSYKLHMLVHKDPEFICETCGFATRHKKSYKEHLTIHKRYDEIEWHTCKICPYQARNKKLLWAHMKKGDHSGKRVVHVRRRDRIRIVPEPRPANATLEDEKAPLLRLNDIFPHSIF